MLGNRMKSEKISLSGKVFWQLNEKRGIRTWDDFLRDEFDIPREIKNPPKYLTATSAKYAPLVALRVGQHFSYFWDDLQGKEDKKRVSLFLAIKRVEKREGYLFETRLIFGGLAVYRVK